MFINKKTKRIIWDMVINIIGTAFPLLVLNLFISPIVAKTIEAEAYGAMQTTMSLVYLIGGTFGGTMSTVRLINEFSYKQKNERGDYNIINIANICIIIIITIFAVNFVLSNISWFRFFLIVIIVILDYAYNYLSVGFRLQLNYRRIFIRKLLTCIGYLIGFGLFFIFKIWEFVFIFSFILPIVFDILKTDLIKEPLSRTTLFKSTLRSFSSLSVATVLSKSLTYFDKLMLYPMLGGVAVSVYFAANIFGKLIVQILEPINNVILSYLSKTSKVEKKTWKMTIIVGGLFCIIMYFVCLVISRPVLKIFYPQWVEAATPLIPIATASMCISSFTSIIRPLTLKDLKTYKQIIINGVSIIVYITISLIMYKTYGLIGYSIALLISYSLKLLIIILFLSFRRKNMNDRG